MQGGDGNRPPVYCGYINRIKWTMDNTPISTSHIAFYYDFRHFIQLSCTAIIISRNCKKITCYFIGEI
jgi:hypothetical protein